MNQGPEGDTGGTGADRVLEAVKLLADHPRPVRLEELARELGAPKSTTHRVLLALRRAGFVEQDEDSRYRLSLEFLRMAFRHYESLDDRTIVQSSLELLVNRFGETAYYARLDRSEVVYLAMMTAPGFVHTAALVGARQPAYRTALGKALLSRTLPDRAAVDRFVEQYGPLTAATPNSLTNAAALDRDLRATRARGYAIDNEENEAGVVCIARPVFLGPQSQPTGAISVAAIELRTPLKELTSRAAEMRDVIERCLGSGAVSEVGETAASRSD
ncbi:MAG: IclR family transcriptional regulator [Candidatus Limnocylindrales bacterium]